MTDQDNDGFYRVIKLIDDESTIGWVVDRIIRLDVGPEEKLAAITKISMLLLVPPGDDGKAVPYADIDWSVAARACAEWFGVVAEQADRRKEVEKEVSAHTTNDPSRLTNPDVTGPEAGRDLFFDLGGGLMRVYDPDTDPAPLYYDKGRVQ